MQLQEMLIENGADIKMKDINGNDSFMYVAYNNRINLIPLFTNSVNVNSTNNVGRTPLILASINGNRDMTQALINLKADLNIKDKDGNTALMYSTFNNKISLVNIFITAKADLNIQNNVGATALIFARYERIR